MQLQDIQAFVRPHAIFPYWRVRSAELSEIGEDRLAEALLLPNCTPEVADAVKARMCEGGKVRDLRPDVVIAAGTVSAQEYENVRADNERLRDDLKYLDRKFTEHCDEMGKALGTDLKLSPAGCVAEAKRLMSNRINVLTDESVPRGKMVFYDPSAPKHVVAQRSYNQGCADTVAAFRKAQGEG